MIPRFRLLSIKLLFGCVVGLGGFRLDHDRGVAALIKLRLVRDGPNNVTGRESHCGAKGSECCDEHRDNDFNDLLLFHGCVFFVCSLGPPNNFNFWGEEELRQLRELRGNEAIDLQFRRQKYC